MRYNTIQLTRALINTVGVDRTIQYLNNNVRIVIRVELDSQGAVGEATVLRCDTLIDKCDVNALLALLKTGDYVFKRCYQLDFEKDRNTILNLAEQETGPFIAYIGLQHDLAQHFFKQDEDVEAFIKIVLSETYSSDSICSQ